MLGHASQNVTQDYVHIDEALKLAVQRTSDEIARLLDLSARRTNQMMMAAKTVFTSANAVDHAGAFKDF